jgi:hypothetical protein
MLLKVPVYFLIERDEKADKIPDVSLFANYLSKLLEEHLSGSSFKLKGSWLENNRVKADFVSSEQALEHLRTKK